MKQLGLLTLILLAAPSLASAQSAQDGAPMPPDGGPRTSAAMAPRGQMLQLRMETRSQMLSALTAQHRILLGRLAGQLATSPSPDLQAAARELDRVLSPQESQAIVAAQQSLRAQLRGGMQPTQQNGYQGPAGGYGQGGYGQGGSGQASNGQGGQGQGGYGEGGPGQGGPGGGADQDGPGPNGSGGSPQGQGYGGQPYGGQGYGGQGYAGPGASGPGAGGPGGQGIDAGLVLLRSALSVAAPARTRNAP